MGSRLVLTKWYGDVIASRTIAPEESPGTADCDGITYEVIDVPYTRASLALGPEVDPRVFLVIVGSGILHVAVALLLFASATPDAAARDREAALRAYIVRTQELAGGPPSFAVERIGTLPELEQASPPVPPALAKPKAHPPAPPPVPRSVPAPALCTAASAPAASGPMCTREVTVTSLARSSPSCFTDTVIRDGQRGMLTFPCQGDGPVTLRFGSASFSGAAIGGTLEACEGTQFQWSDGCTWTSAQRVRGSVRSAELTFTYGEAPKAGQHDCAWACSATGTVRATGPVREDGT